LVNRLVAALLVLALAVVAARACWFPPECPVAKVFGRPCVACGVTRDVRLLLHGHRPVHNPCSLLYAIWFPVEVVFRVAGGFLRHPRLFAAVDVFSHVLLLATWAVLILPFLMHS
jgi:hypothetical protein